MNNNVCESRYLDYKQDINLEKGDDRKEFLFDISSFANSEGGVIIYGISEQLDENNKNTGLPDKILGLKNKNIDALILQIEDLIRTSIEPNISDIVIKPLEKENIKLLFIGRIQEQTKKPLR